MCEKGGECEEGGGRCEEGGGVRREVFFWEGVERGAV